VLFGAILTPGIRLALAVKRRISRVELRGIRRIYREAVMRSESNPNPAVAPARQHKARAVERASLARPW
jgi:hypothetical protein